MKCIELYWYSKSLISYLGDTEVEEMPEEEAPSTLADCMEDYDEAEVEEWTPGSKK